ncbi:TniQ family protein [Dyella japonica]
MKPSVATGTRWFVPGPGPDETLWSVVGRAAAFYDTHANALWAGLHGEELDTSGTPDHPSAAALQRVGRALGVSAASLRDHLLDTGPRWLNREARRAFCPACWMEDHAAGRPFGYRRTWARVFATRCTMHNQPLQYAHALEGADTDWVTALVLSHQSEGRAATRRPSGSDGELLDWIDGLARALDDVYFNASPWPSIWLLDRFTAEQRLLESCRGQPVGSDALSIDRVMVPPTLRRFVHTRCALVAAMKTPRWDDLQSLADPGARRAAIWLLGWQLLPDLPERYCPLWPPDP